MPYFQDNIYSGDYVADYIRDITPYEDDIPEGWIHEYVLPNTFELKIVDINTALNDKNFVHYLSSKEYKDSITYNTPINILTQDLRDYIYDISKDKLDELDAEGYYNDIDLDGMTKEEDLTNLMEYGTLSDLLELFNNDIIDYILEKDKANLDRYRQLDDGSYVYNVDGNTPADHVSYETLFNPIVIVGDILIDGYSRTATLMAMGEDTIEAFVSI